ARMLLLDSSKLDAAPATAINLDIVVAPADVRFVRPPLLVQVPQNIADKCQTIHRFTAPILRLINGFTAFAQRDRFERLLRCQGCRAEEEAALITSPAAHDWLEEIEQSNQWPRPRAQFVPRQSRLRASGAADGDRDQQCGDCDRQERQPNCG